MATGWKHLIETSQQISLWKNGKIISQFWVENIVGVAAQFCVVNLLDFGDFSLH